MSHLWTLPTNGLPAWPLHDKSVVPQPKSPSASLDIPGHHMPVNHRPFTTRVDLAYTMNLSLWLTHHSAIHWKIVGKKFFKKEAPSLGETVILTPKVLHFWIPNWATYCDMLNVQVYDDIMAEAKDLVIFPLSGCTGKPLLTGHDTTPALVLERKGNEVDMVEKSEQLIFLMLKSPYSGQAISRQLMLAGRSTRHILKPSSDGFWGRN